MEEEDCMIDIVKTPNQKKLKQARLPFQTSSPSELSDTAINKKRKLSSPSPTNLRNEKVAKKENILKDNESQNDKIPKDDDQELAENDSSEANKKTDNKIPMKANALTRFLQKGSVSTVNIKRKEPERVLPVVVISDTDDEKDEIKSHGTSEKQPNDTLTESVTEEDSSQGKSTEEFGDMSMVNSDIDTESSSSDDDDDNDGDKKSNNDTDDAGQKTDNSEVSNKNDGRSEISNKKLTPRQLEKKMAIKRRREERQKLRIEREHQRMEEKMKRKQEKEAEKEQKRKEKEHRELKKQMEIEQKQKEKERKEEDRRKREEAKEEEKRRKEEERLELERKKQKAASTFVSFFVPKKQETKLAVEEKVIGACNFMPFEIKADMKVAPTCRRSLSDAEKLALDMVCFNNTAPPSKMYLDDIKNDRSKIHRSRKTWPAEAKDDIIVLEDDDINSENIIDQTTSIEKHRAKLIQFAENRRPPYWGTWRKKTIQIGPRKPLNKDTKWFDYEIDSDEEWEEEEPGELLRGSDDEKDEENPDDDEYDVDNEFMVPHGYLSDEEARPDDEDDENMTPETQKVKLKILGEQFEAEMNEKTAKIKPKIIGCIWQGPLNSYPENLSSNLVKFLTERQAWVAETPITIANPGEIDASAEAETSSMKKQVTPGKKKTAVPQEALPDLIRLIHGNSYGRLFLIKEFITYWYKKKPEEKQQLSKVSIAQKIQELASRIACPEEGPMHMKTCWYVPEKTRKKYLEEDLILPNKWSYVLTPKRKMLSEVTKLVEKIEKEKDKDVDQDEDREQKDKEKKSVPLITQFTKKITQEEMKKQLSVKSSPKSLVTVTPKKPPKRVPLISVARGESFPKAPVIGVFTKALQSTSDSIENTSGIYNDPIIISDSSNSPQKQDVSK